MNYLGNVIGFTDHLSLIEAINKWFIFLKVSKADTGGSDVRKRL